MENTKTMKINNIETLTVKATQMEMYTRYTFTNLFNGATGELDIQEDYFTEWNDFDNNLLGDDIDMMQEVMYGLPIYEDFANDFVSDLKKLAK
jgi:hypothetical protein